jgi:ribonuclease J
MGIAADLGYLRIPDGLVVDMKVLEKLPATDIVLICTGSQGEPMAALSRMANKDHVIDIGPGDTVLLASSLIPGNENAIYRIINAFTRWGANVVHKGNAKVHVSGHASAGELAYCYNLLRPTAVLPVHGEWRHLTANAAIAMRTGIDEKQVFVVEDGISIDLVAGKARVSGRVAAEHVLVDGGTMGVATDDALADRRVLAEEGSITVLAIIQPDTGKLTEPLEFFSRGFVAEPGWEQDASKPIEEALAAAASKPAGSREDLEEVITRTLGRWLGRRYRRNPVITTIAVEE